MRKRSSFLPEYLLIAFAAWVCLAWLGRRPLPPPIGSNFEQHFGVVAVPLKLLEIAPDPGRLALAFYLLLSVTTLLACALAMMLLLRSSRIPAARVLAASLAFGAACVAYTFYLRVFPALGAERLGGWTLPLDFIGSGLYAMSLLAAMKFFAAYPFAIELPAFVREEIDGKRVAAVEGWFPWLYRNVGRWDTVQDADERAARAESFFARLATPTAQRLIVLGFALAGMLSVVMGRALHGLFTVVAVLAALYVFWFGLACLRYKYKRALEDDRQRIQWLYFGAWVAGLMLLGWSLFVVVAPLRGIEYYPVTAFATLASIAPVLAGFIGLSSLAISIFYGGAIDPGLAIRRTTIYTMLAGLLGFLFVVFERMLAVFAAGHLGLDQDLGTIIAGGLAAALLLPLRRFVEGGASRLVERWTPLENVGDGPRHVAAVVFSDLSGYTALTARDERAAMIAVALFHREAKRACEQHEGRLVKTIGDAVHLEFRSAREALAAVREIHERYPKGAAALDIPALEIHSGLHYGEVMAAPDGDIYGTVVNLAARLQGQARDGEIVVSGAIREACGEERFNDLGSVALKNVPEKMQLYALG